MMQAIGRWVLGLGMVLVAVGVLSAPVAAQQDRYWVQIESHPDLATANDRARAYSGLLGNVNGYTLASGWYALAVGPFSQAEARQVIVRLGAQGLIPRDAYLQDATPYRQQFWPVGVNNLNTPLEQAQVPATPVVTPLPQPLPPAALPEETVNEARRSEASLDQAGREELQIALEWTGFYSSGIDGDFGPGTRRAMADWQAANGHDATGVLTTRQRAELLATYQAELAILGMQLVRDQSAGVEIELPMSMVQFGRYEYPFAQYDSRDDSGVQVLLISQSGDRATLAGLYEIMQTLEIVPLEGTRRRRNDSFVLTGQNDSLRSHTVARLQDGQIKGFTLIWTPENDQQMARALPMMENSLSFFGGTLDPGATDPGMEQDIDLLAGLEVRRPAVSRSGFYADANGAVLTTVEAVESCGRVMIDGQYEAQVAFRDDTLGLAVLRPVERLAPMVYASFAPTPARLRADVALAGFPYDGALGAASLNFGTLAELRGLNGDETVQRLEMDTLPSEAGGPLLDTNGVVLGMLLPPAPSGRELPPGVSFALRADLLAETLAQAGVQTRVAGDTTSPLGREALSRMGANLAVLVTCWN